MKTELVEVPVGFLAALRQIIGGVALPIPFDQVVKLNEGFEQCRVVTEGKDE